MKKQQTLSILHFEIWGHISAGFVGISLYISNGFSKPQWILQANFCILKLRLHNTCFLREGEGRELLTVLRIKKSSDFCRCSRICSSSMIVQGETLNGGINMGAYMRETFRAYAPNIRAKMSLIPDDDRSDSIIGGRQLGQSTPIITSYFHQCKTG